MHRCLSIIEVQRAIFQEVGREYEGLATVAKLARTCRIFNDVALDVLWKNLHSFVFLVQCLPRDLWKKTEGGVVVFQRPMSLGDWEIFFKYSSRVRTIHQGSMDTYGPTLSNEVIFMLSNPPANGPLVPHLKTLSWSNLDKRHASLLPLLLPPSLASLSLDPCALSSPEISTLTLTNTTCPSLRYLSITLITVTTLDTERKKTLSNLLLHLPSLESLRCMPVDETAVVNICQIPSLVDVWLGFQRDFRLDRVLTHVMSPSFASLRVLTLYVHTLPSSTSLFEHMRFRPESLSFAMVDTPSPDMLRLFFLKLADACGSEKLSHVSLTMPSKRHGAPHEVSLSTLQPLLLLPSIRSFEFDIGYNFVLDDDTITTLAVCWPKLTSLLLNASSGWRAALRVTHKGLITLLSRCTALTNLAIAIDFSGIDLPSEEIPNVRPGGGVTNCKCTRINFVMSEIHYPATIAAFLSDICPELRTVSSSRNSGGMQKQWDAVKGLLPAFHAVRRQCLDWIARKTGEDSVGRASDEMC